MKRCRRPNRCRHCWYSTSCGETLPAVEDGGRVNTTVNATATNLHQAVQKKLYGQRRQTKATRGQQTGMRYPRCSSLGGRSNTHAGGLILVGAVWAGRTARRHLWCSLGWDRGCNGMIASM